MLSLADSISFLKWWGMFFLIGVIFLPITTRLLGSFFDKGYAFSKVIGIVILSYLVLTFGAAHILPFSSLNCLLILLWCLFMEGIVFLRYSFTTFIKNTCASLKKIWGMLFFEELLFFVGLYAWSYVRTFDPDIHGLEKYMDYGFVNSILRSSYFPPKDMWYTPLPINYYYFGHFMTAVMTKLTLLPSNITFNLMIATLFALTLSLGFTLAYNLFSHFQQNYKKNLSLFHKYKDIILCGILCAFLLGLGGNLHTIYSFFKPYNTDNPVPPTSLVFALQTFPNSYWYPNATRFIYHTIHEFPGYSFVVSDLHGHVLDIPVVLTAIALLFTLYTEISLLLATKKKNRISLLRNILIPGYPYAKWIFYGFLLGVMYMTNAWDGMIYFLLALPVAFLSFKKSRFFQISDLIEPAFLQTILILFAGLLVFSLPFSLFFQPGALVGGIGLICSPSFLIAKGKIGPFVFESAHCAHSPWWQLVILYGFFLFWLLGLFAVMIRQWKKEKKIFSTDIFALILAGVGCLLIIIPEFFYLKDIYATYFRANTMFKLVYQAFILLTIVSAYALTRFFSYRGWFKNFKSYLFFLLFGSVGLLLFGLVALYPYFSIPSYYNNLKNPKSLDGTAYLATLYPSDYKAIQWINATIPGQPVIAEAVGDSYTDYARVSANTGLPTVIGWPVHEWLWRGTYDIVPPRSTDIQNLYETLDAQTAQAIISKYHISFVFVGQLERQKYKVQEAKFEQLGHAVYHNGLTTIYQVFP